MATPPRTATIVGSDGDDGSDSGSAATQVVEETVAARTPHAFPRAAARMMQVLGFLYTVGTERVSASAWRWCPRGWRVD